jgi:hypothetical protein
MRSRDVHAILFWLATTITLILALQGAFHHWAFTAVAAAAYNAWLLSRPRMIRVFRRLRGERLERWGGYFID